MGIVRYGKVNNGENDSGIGRNRTRWPSRHFTRRLALQFNIINLDWLEHNIPTSLYDEWFYHFMDEPQGYESEVHRHAELCSLIAVQYQSKKYKPSYKEFVYPAVTDDDEYGDDMTEEQAIEQAKKFKALLAGNIGGFEDGP